MLAEINKDELAVLKPAKFQPNVSVIMPFDPKMASKERIRHSLKVAADEVKRQLYQNYTEETAKIVLEKLHTAISGLDYTTHKKSVAIYISPLVEKIYYLSIDVQEKIMVDESFEIRDLVLNKKDMHEFLLAVISAKKEKIYVGNSEKITPIVANHMAHIKRDLPERVANFSDPKKIKEIHLRNFLRHIDNGLSFILKAYPLPLFVMTTEKTMGYFRQVTKNAQYITGFIHGNFEHASEYELLQSLGPHLENWKSVTEKDVFNRLKTAQNDFKLSAGIADVWKHANCKHGQLLVVEKDFCYPAQRGANGETIFCADNTEKIFNVKDAVDDIIERVLEGGGDVEFVDDLKDYEHIALIEYYTPKN
jgi:hypothetical protein